MFCYVRWVNIFVYKNKNKHAISDHFVMFCFDFVWRHVSAECSCCDNTASNSSTVCVWISFCVHVLCEFLYLCIVLLITIQTWVFVRIQLSALVVSSHWNNDWYCYYLRSKMTDGLFKKYTGCPKKMFHYSDMLPPFHNVWCIIKWPNNSSSQKGL